MTAEGATFPGQDTPDTERIRYRLALRLEVTPRTILALCDALDAATARREHFLAERDRARGTAAALEAELAAIRTLAEGMSDFGTEEVRDFGDDILRAIGAPTPRELRQAGEPR